MSTMPRIVKVLVDSEKVTRREHHWLAEVRFDDDSNDVRSGSARTEARSLRHATQALEIMVGNAALDEPVDGSTMFSTMFSTQITNSTLDLPPVNLSPKETGEYSGWIRWEDLPPVGPTRSTPD